MVSARALAIAIGIVLVLWLALDSGLVNREPAPPGTTVALGILGTVFALSAFVMHAGGQPQRVPLLVGTALGTLGYCAFRVFGL